LAVRSASGGTDKESMTWWEWVVVAIWGPATVAVAGMLLGVVVDKTRKRIARRRPVFTDRRQPGQAWLRDAIDGRGVSAATDRRGVSTIEDRRTVSAAMDRADSELSELDSASGL
jgi:hypothetical protein